MIAKITKGSGFGGACRYVLDKKKDAEVLASVGVHLKELQAITQSFEIQAELNERVKKHVCHTSLSFSTVDNPSNELMTKVALEYLKKMGVKETQFLIVKHNDKQHPHLHIIYNRVDNFGKTISDAHDRFRSEKICKDLTLKYGLYMALGKENVKRERLRELESTKYRIYDALCKYVPKSKSWAELEKRLEYNGITTSFKTKGSTSQVEGVRFTMNKLTFNGSKVDRQFSYSKIDFALSQNARQVEVPANRPYNTPSVDLGGLLDFKQHGVDYDEEEFRRQQQRRRKKQIKM